MSATSRRVLFTLAMLVAYRFGFTVPIPGLSPEFLSSHRDQGSLIGLLNACSGGSIGQTTVVALALLPYFTTSILCWFLTNAMSARRTEHASNASIRANLERWKRTAVVPIAMTQALA